MVDGVETLEDSATPAAQLSLHALSGEQEVDMFRILGRISTTIDQILSVGGVPITLSTMPLLTHWAY